MRNSKINTEMGMVIILGVMVLLSLHIMPSSAQVMDCFDKITNCSSNNSSTDPLKCCPVVKQVIAEENECFCTFKDVVIAVPSAAKIWSEVFSTCGINGSFETLCPGSSQSPSAAPSPPAGFDTSPSEAPLSSPPGSTTSHSQSPSDSPGKSVPGAAHNIATSFVSSLLVILIAVIIY